MDWLWILTTIIMVIYICMFFFNKINKNIITISLTIWDIILVIIYIVLLIVNFI